MNEYKQKCLETWKQIKDADIMNTVDSWEEAQEELCMLKERLSEGMKYSCHACEVATQKYNQTDRKDLGISAMCAFCPVEWVEGEECKCEEYPSPFADLSNEDAEQGDWDELVDEVIERIEQSADSAWEIPEEKV